MLDFSYLKPAFMKKLKSHNLKNVIIQHGPKLVSLDCFENQQTQNLTVKKINLEKRPASVHSSSNKFRKNSVPKQSEGSFNSTTKQILQYKRQNYFSKTCNLKQEFIFEQNPFQNERLKSPLSKRAIRNIIC